MKSDLELTNVLSIVFFASALILHSVTSSQAAIITSPTSLNPGDQYRLAFVTTGTRDATSSNIADYNSFVQDAADAVPGLASLGATWTAIASTDSVNARDNTETNPNVSLGVPIYLLNDTILADSNSDLWDGSIDMSLNRSELDAIIDGTVWTGTDENGVKFSTFFALGSGTAAIIGHTGFIANRWVIHVQEFQASPLHFYALSSILAVAAVPEPSSSVLLSFVVIGTLVRRRHLSR